MTKNTKNRRDYKIKTQSFDLFVRFSGDGKPTPRESVILLHGMGLSGRYMTPLLRQLGNHYHAYALDLPGFGKSEKPSFILNIQELANAVIEFMDAANLEKAVLVANSVGCQIALDCAFRFPQRVKSLILISPTGDPESRNVPVQIFRWSLYFPRQIFSSQPRFLIKDYLQCGTRRFWRTFLYSLKDRMIDKVPKITQPALVIQGTKDPIITDAWVRHLTSLLPNGRLHIEHGGHTLNYTKPTVISDIIQRFIVEKNQHI